MAKRLKIATSLDVRTIKQICTDLKGLIRTAKHVECPALAAKLQSALNSAEGAVRHAERAQRAWEEANRDKIEATNKALEEGVRRMVRGER